MIKTIKNISKETLSINLFSRTIELPPNWTIAEEEVWGQEELLCYIAAKFNGKVLVLDEEGNEVKSIECPGCRNDIKVELLKENRISESSKEEVEQKVIKRGRPKK